MKRIKKWWHRLRIREIQSEIWFHQESVKIEIKKLEKHRNKLKNL